MSGIKFGHLILHIQYLTPASVGANTEILGNIMHNTQGGSLFDTAAILNAPP
jgi:hypothetical protein